MRYMRYLITLAVLILGLSMPADAHKVSVFAWVEGKTVHTESKFSGGKKVKDGKIEVFDHLNQTVVEGVTDGRGYFTFPLPNDARTLKVVLTAGMGHSNHWLITAQELGNDSAEPATPAVMPTPVSDVQRFPDNQVLEQIVERAVEKKLAPLKAQLAEQAWGMRDIVAGIGYILGLMGLASYMHHRKNGKR